MSARPVYRFDRFIFNLERGCLQDGHAEVELRPKSFEVLRQLVENAGRLMSKDELVRLVWPNVVVSDDSLAHCIRDIRKALNDETERFIKTVPRRGYMFVAELASLTANEAAAARSETSVVVRAEARAFCVLMGEDEATARNALNTSRQLVVSKLEHHGGRVVSTSLDTVIAVFTDAAKGVSAAAGARDALVELNRNLPGESRVHYRFGVASGEISGGADGPGGPAVEHAATLSLRAQADAVRLSEAVQAALPADSALATTKAEADGYELARSGVSATGKALPLQLQLLDLPLPERPSIVLLPFKATGNNPDEGGALAEGLRIDIQNALTKMSGVFLVGAGSANAMRGWLAMDAGARAGVRYVLEGTVQRSGDQVRVSVQLTDTVAGTVAWSERYDRVLDHNFTLQDDITARIVTALDIKLASGAQARIWHQCLTDPQAREFFYRGIYAFFRMNAESMLRARDCFTRVDELVPTSPFGATWMALCLWFESTRGWAADPVAARAQAGIWAERAAAMEDADGQAQTVLGNVRLLQRRFDEAMSIAHEALTIRPGCSNANGFLANVLLYCGEPLKAIAHARRAIRYMPVYPPWFVEILAAAYRDAGLLDLAIIAARELPRIAPSAMQGRLILASALVRSGWLADARWVVRESRVLDANLSLGRWAASQPYRNADVLAGVTDDLRKSGVPE